MERRRTLTHRLTRKQLNVLDVFLRHGPDYVANPARLRKDSLNRITKAWARETCERLVARGILSMQEVRPRKKRSPTRHYRLAKTPEAFHSLVGAYLVSLSRIYGPDWPMLTTTLFESRYMKANLTPDLVRRVFSARKVEIRYCVDQKTLNPLVSYGEWSELPETSTSFESPVALCFPVADPGASFDELKGAIHGFGENLSLEPQALGKVAEQHYQVLEDRLLVLPILGLLQISPTALLQFLGEWEPYQPDSMSIPDQGIGMIEHLLFRLVFAAIRDLSITRQVPSGVDVIHAEVRPEQGQAQRHDPALLQLSWRSKQIIGYEAGFDTDHLFVGGEDSGNLNIAEVTRNPENCWVRIWWDSKVPIWGEDGLEAKIGFRFADRKLLEWALTHSSASESTDETRSFVKRSSWLGDAILQSVATESILRRLGPAAVGQLDNLRQDLTSNAFLGDIAQRIGLPYHLRTGEALEANPSANDRHRMHATHLEALIGATFLDGGFRAARRVVGRLLDTALRSDDHPAAAT